MEPTSSAVSVGAGSLAGMELNRTLLAADGELDDTSTVTWVQGAQWYCDVRRPADFVAPTAGCLADLDRADLHALARQQGFAGRLVDGHVAGTRGSHVVWSHEVDLHPDTPADAGVLELAGPDIVHERGVHADYLEHWRIVGRGEAREWQLVDPHTGARGVLVVVGNRFGWARGRADGFRGALTDAIDAAVSDDDARALFDCEVCIGTVRGPAGAAWTVTMSTLPFREGAQLGPLLGESTVTVTDFDPNGQEVRRNWAVCDSQSTRSTP
ncbi:hypothetical protein [Rhodococcus sp. HNM0569]|uniref:hypothetical protein n=1 Tax=Rhodococcus sp. HNM0569 TaxID=2716340 RepID=UPI00146B027A|nr:hypothetical protein [Rhodococcus sp. HNM0569]NLU84857.1 hypothetical protein [Rhodococcus sp. HNM0569]